MSNDQPYRVRQFNLGGLAGISDQTLEMHFKLYEGYVKQTNLLRERIAQFLEDGKIEQEEMPAYAELKRRLGFEYNGMVLHEYYFENLTRRSTTPTRSATFLQAAEASFGNYDRWKADFVGVGGLRGVGWAICYQDRQIGQLSNHWITLHEAGNIAGFLPILVMDVWEHAYLLDYKPAERSKYIEAFFTNIDWECVEERAHSTHQQFVTAGPPTSRATTGRMSRRKEVSSMDPKSKPQPSQREPKRGKAERDRQDDPRRPEHADPFESERREDPTRQR